MCGLVWLLRGTISWQKAGFSNATGYTAGTRLGNEAKFLNGLIFRGRSRVPRKRLPEWSLTSEIGQRPKQRWGRCQVSNHPRRESGLMFLSSIFEQVNYSNTAGKSNFKSNRFAFSFCCCNERER